MKKRNFFLWGILFISLLAVQCNKDEFNEPTEELTLKKGKPVPGIDAGNCLSFPVIWAEGVTKTLRGTPEMDPVTNGEWWYWWGISGDDPNNTVILSGPPDPDNNDFIDDGTEGSWDETKVPGEGWVKAFLQRDPYNIWQAEHVDGSANKVVVDKIDWGDNLESVPWDMRSQVRTEVVLIKDLLSPMLAYEMRHVSGWGIEEVHGLAYQSQGEGAGALTYASMNATVYSHCARLTIQKLNVKREDIPDGALVWVPEEGWKESELITEDIIKDVPTFNLAVYEGVDGPGYYSAEINVKGKIIYGYTWNVRRLNDGPGDYRITFSFDDFGSTTNFAPLNTFFEEGTTEILVPVEEPESVVIDSEDSDHGGGVAQIDFSNNLTYIDIRIEESNAGGGGGSKKSR